MGTVYRYRAFDPSSETYVEWTSGEIDPKGYGYDGETPFDQLEGVVMVRRIETLEDESSERMLLDVLDEDLDDGDVWTVEFEPSPNTYVKVSGYIKDQCLCPSTDVPTSAFRPEDWVVMGDERGAEAMSFNSSSEPVVDNAKMGSRTAWSIPGLDLIAPGSWRMDFELEILSEQSKVELADLFGFGLYSVGFDQEGQVLSKFARKGRSIFTGISDGPESYLNISEDMMDVPGPGVLVGSAGWSSLPDGYLHALIANSTAIGGAEDHLLRAWGGTAPYPEGMGEWTKSAVPPMMRFMLEVAPAHKCGVHFKLRPRRLKWSPIDLDHF